MKKFVLPVLILGFGMLSVMLFNKQMPRTQYMPSYEFKKKVPLAQKIDGRAEERARMLRNIETGKVQFSDWNKALHQIKNLSSGLGTRAGDIDWESNGPNQVSGRSRAFVFDKTKPGRCYSGGVSGGIFVSDTLGNDWRPVEGFEDDLNVLPIACMVQSKDGDIYAGTGPFWDGGGQGAFGSSFFGNGIYKKSAGSDQWVHLESTITGDLTVANNGGDFSLLTDMACDPNNNDIVYVSTNSGLFKTTDGGTTWNRLTGLGSGACQQIKINSDNTILYAGYNGQVYKSTDEGTTWSLATSDPTHRSSVFNRHMRIAVAHDSPNIAYAVFVASGGDLNVIIRTDDGGENWEVIGTKSGILRPFCSYQNGTGWLCQGRYDVCLAVSPKDANRVYLGGMQRFYSWSRKLGWVQIAFWQGTLGEDEVHADMHEFAFHPTHPDTMVIVTDGGPYMSYNGHSGFPDNIHWKPRLKGYHITQFYDGNVNKYGEMIGGAQDNGTNLTLIDGTSRGLSTEIGGGDGFGCAISARGDHQIAFSTIYTGQVFRTKNLSNVRKNIITGTFAETVSNGFDANFNTRIHLAESEPIEIFNGDKQMPDSVEHSYLFGLSSVFLGQNLYRSFVFISKNATEVNDPFVKWTRRIPCMDNSNNYLFSAAHSKELEKIYFVGTGGMSVLENINDAPFDTIRGLNASNARVLGYSSTGIDIDRVNGSPTNLGGVFVDQNDKDRVIVTQIGFGGTDKVYEFKNGSFTSKQGNLPIMPVYCCAIDPTDSKHVLVGTEFGIWETDDISASSPEWVEQNKNIGRVPVFQLRVNYLREKECTMLYAITHGRGFFKIPFPENINCDYSLKRRAGTSAVSHVESRMNKLSIYPNPAISDKVNVKFENKKREDVNLRLYDMAGRIVKNISVKAVSGDNLFNINVKGIQKGQYILRLEGEENVIGGDILQIK